MIKHSVLSVMAGLYFSCYSPLVTLTLCDGLKISEYEVHRQMGFSLINIAGCMHTKNYNNYGNL